MDINSPLLNKDDVGVDNNRLIVTTKPIDYGTFAVTTAPWTDNNMASDRVYQTIPYAKATGFRINNHTGKVIGIRRRHKKIVIDDFEDGDHSDWVGSVSNTTIDIDGFVSGKIKSQAYKVISTQAIPNGSEIEVKFRTPNISSFTVNIKLWDDPSRIGIGNPASEFSDSSLLKDTEYKLIFRLDVSGSTYDSFLESDSRVSVATSTSGEFGTSNMANSVIAIDCTEDLIVDSIVYQQKVDYSVEHILSPASMVYPCEDNISEYEVINLGSDTLNYSDTNTVVTLSGFYAV